MGAIGSVSLIQSFSRKESFSLTDEMMNCVSTMKPTQHEVPPYWKKLHPLYRVGLLQGLPQGISPLCNQRCTCSDGICSHEASFCCQARLHIPSDTDRELSVLWLTTLSQSSDLCIVRSKHGSYAVKTSSACPKSLLDRTTEGGIVPAEVLKYFQGMSSDMLGACFSSSTIRVADGSAYIP